MDHMSTSFPYNWPLKTSGATYPGVPQAKCINSFGFKIFANPKSANFNTEFGSEVAYKIFSGFKSL